VLLAFTGLRIREALGLTWAGVTGAVDGATLEPRATDRGSPGMTKRRRFPDLRLFGTASAG